MPVRNVDDIYKLQKHVIKNGFGNNVEPRNATSTCAYKFKRNYEAANMSSETQIDKIMRLSANKSDKQKKQSYTLPLCKRCLI